MVKEWAVLSGNGDAAPGAAAAAGAIAVPLLPPPQRICTVREVENATELSDSDKAFGQGITFITSILASVLLSVVMTASPPEGKDRIQAEAWPILCVLAVLCAFFSMVASVLMQTKKIPRWMFDVAFFFLLAALDISLAALACNTDSKFSAYVAKVTKGACIAFGILLTCGGIYGYYLRYATALKQCATWCWTTLCTWVTGGHAGAH